MDKRCKNIFSVLGKGGVVLFCTISVLLATGITWMFDTWQHLSMDELLYQLTAPIEGTSDSVIEEFVTTCVPITVLAFFAVVIIMISIKKRKVLRISVVILLCISLACDAYYLGMAWDRLEIKDYLNNKNELSDFIGDNYVAASDVGIEFPEKKRNLIYIFLESMETTYADVASGGAYEENYIKELTALAQGNEDFSGDTQTLNGAYMMPQTTWTIAGMVAQTAGLPLDIPIHGLDMDTQETFFPGISTLGDVLAQAGYSQTLFIGSEAAFAGRELYFTEHGNYAMKDYNYAIDQGRIAPDYKVWWGYEDKKLFEYAKEELLELAKQEEPFNFTMLTADTHFEDGYVCEDCGSEYGDDRYANVISCSSSKVYEFVEWIKEQDFYENTTIVISGDHLTMDSDFCVDIDKTNARKVYTAYINAAATPENVDDRRQYTVFDQYPTTLASLGVIIEGNRLALGTNLFSSEATLLEKYGWDYVTGELNKESAFMNELASTIDLENRELLIREGELVGATVTVEAYDALAKEMRVYITEFKNTEEAIQSIDVAIWTEEDQSDLQWLPAVIMEDGNCYIDIDIADFGYKSGDYNIDAYVTNLDGTQEFLGQAIGHVE